MGQTKNMASPARAWAITFVCHLENSLWELVNWEVKRDQHVVMICPNSEMFSLREWNTSHIVLESISKSMLSNSISFNHCKAFYKLITSPTSVGYTLGKITVFAKIKTPSTSLTQMPIPIQFW